MKNWLQATKYTTAALTLGIILALAMFLALTIGNVRLPNSVIWETLVNGWNSSLPIEAPGQGGIHDIVWLLRFPRILMAALVGAGLAVSGVVMQAIVRNPLADPYILGISSGASLGATVAILFGLSFTFGDNSVGIMAFMGAFAISLGVIFIANMGGRANSTKLLLAGLALSAVCSSFTSLV
ncbi:iron chelate uptake ABC transporter family permease subunit, partial [Veillonella sp.]